MTDSRGEGAGSRQADLPLPVHPDVTILDLANGLSCWIRPHPHPPRAVSMGLRVGVGSLCEEEAERGVSHLLEHLAFAGGVNFSPGELQRFFDALGTRLGKDHNAFTGMESTFYSLSLPDHGEDTIDRGLACLADFAFRSSLPPAAVAAERQVILEEMRRHHGAKTRLREQILSLLLPGSRIAERHPLGLEQVVRSVSIERIRSYYDRWYRPERSTLLIVGDVDPAVVERWVHYHFLDWRPASEASRPRSTESASTVGVRPRAVVFADPEVERAELRLVSLRPAHGLATVGALRRRLTEEIGLWLTHRHLGRLIREGEVPFRQASLSVSPLVREWDLVQAIGCGPPDQCREMLAALTREIRRVQVHGFADPEIEWAREQLLTGARRAVRQEAEVSAGALLTEMNEAVPEGRPPMAETQKLDLLAELLPTVTAEEVRSIFTTRLDPSRQLTVAVMPERPGVRLPSEEELLLLQQQAADRPVGPPVVRATPRALMAGAPGPGTVADQRCAPELGVRSLTLGNGVCVHLRPMVSRKGQVALDLTLVGGRIREQAENFGITGAAALPFSQPATETLSSTQIRDLTADAGVQLRSLVEEDALTLRLAGEARDLERGLQLIHLLLTRPRLEAAAFERWQSQAAERRELSLEARLSLETLRLLTGDDPRFRLMTGDQARSLRLDQAEEWLRSRLCAAPIEVAIAGDVEDDRASDLALRYLGSLPARALSDTGLDDLRRLAPERGPLESQIEEAAVTPRAAVSNAWRAAPWPAIDDRRLLRMATQILNQRLHEELRTRRGMTYDADSAFSPSKAYPQASLLSIAFYAPPERVTEGLAATRGLVEALAEDGPSESEMEAACKRFSELAVRVEAEPRYWAHVLTDCVYRGLPLDQLERVPERFLEFTREDLRSALARYVTEDRYLAVMCLPAGISLVSS